MIPQHYQFEMECGGKPKVSHVSCSPVTLKKADVADEETKRIDKPEEGRGGREEVAKCPQMEFEIGDLTD